MPHIHPLVTTLCDHLRQLQTTINQNESIVNEDVSSLDTEANKLYKDILKRQLPLDNDEKKELKTLMYSIQHSKSFTIAVGEQQAALLNVFQRLENCIEKKFQNKVTPVEPSSAS
jgi:hypothetical protein